MIDERKLEDLRNRWFARASSPNQPGTPTWKEIQELYNEVVEHATDKERVHITRLILRDVPADERERAVDYLLKNISTETVERLYGIIKKENLDKDLSEWHDTYLMGVRDLLRQGGFTWYGTLLDDLSGPILYECIARYCERRNISM